MTLPVNEYSCSATTLQPSWYVPFLYSFCSESHHGLPFRTDPVDVVFQSRRSPGPPDTWLLVPVDPWDSPKGSVVYPGDEFLAVQEMTVQLDEMNMAHCWSFNIFFLLWSKCGLCMRSLTHSCPALVTTLAQYQLRWHLRSGYPASLRQDTLGQVQKSTKS